MLKKIEDINLKNIDLYGFEKQVNNIRRDVDRIKQNRKLMNKLNKINLNKSNCK